MTTNVHINLHKTEWINVYDADAYIWRSTQTDWYTQPTGKIYLCKETCFFRNLKVEDLNMDNNNSSRPVTFHYSTNYKQLFSIRTFFTCMSLTAQSASRWKKSWGKSRFGGRLFPYPGGSHAIMVNLHLSKPSTCGLKSLHIDPRKSKHHHQCSQHPKLFSFWMNTTHSFIAINNTEVFEPHTALRWGCVCQWFQELISVTGTLQELDKEGEEQEVNSVVFI